MMTYETYCVSVGCLNENKCARRLPLVPEKGDRYISASVFNFDIVDGITVCDYFIEKQQIERQR